MKKLAQLLRDEMDARRLNVRQLAQQLNLSHATVTRVLAALPVDMQTMMTICDWLGISLVDALDQKPEDANLSRRLAVLINRQPELGALLTDALAEVEEERMSAEDVRDIADFIVYKLTRHQIRGRSPSPVQKEDSQAG